MFVGYEWWLMVEAKKRNPDILLYALSWGVPGWIGNGSFFSQDNIDYHIKWLQGAKQVYGLDILLISRFFLPTLLLKGDRYFIKRIK